MSDVFDQEFLFLAEIFVNLRIFQGGARLSEALATSAVLLLSLLVGQHPEKDDVLQQGSRPKSSLRPFRLHADLRALAIPTGLTDLARHHVHRTPFYTASRLAVPRRAANVAYLRWNICSSGIDCIEPIGERTLCNSRNYCHRSECLRNRRLFPESLGKIDELTGTRIATDTAELTGNSVVALIAR